MLLKIAALLAAISHTYHETIHELKSDAAAEKAGMTDYMLEQAHSAYRRRQSVILAGAADRRKQAGDLSVSAQAAGKRRDQAQSIINIVRGEA